jgi:hypothetical protein
LPWSALIAVFFPPLISVFFLELYFLPAPHPVSFSFCLWNFSQPPTYYPSLSPTDLLTYNFKMCYSHPHPPTCPTTDLPINTLSR